MAAEFFLDTNILIYSASSAPADVDKQQIAISLLKTFDFAISTQVLQEYIANASGKKSLWIGEDKIPYMLGVIEFATVLPVTKKLILEGLKIRRRFQVSHWDSTIIAAALEIGCKVLYTEDLNHGQDYGGVRAFNPFL